ncbi:MAG: hypothetical protein ABI824_07330 [Acidobacteriota bacterium]
MSEPSSSKSSAVEPTSAPESILSPEEEECLIKQVELAELTGKVAQAELDLTTLHGHLKAFEGRYLQVVAPLMAEMEDLKEDAAEVHARRAQREEELAGCSSTAHGGINSDAGCPPGEMKTLFREVAKSIHPDLGTNAADRQYRDGVMAYANAAYASGNPERLRKLLLEWKADPDAVPGNDVGARLIRVIRQIARAKNRIAEVRIEMQELHRTDLYFLRQRSERAISEGRDLLDEMRGNLQKQLDTQKLQVQAMKERAGKDAAKVSIPCA